MQSWSGPLDVSPLLITYFPLADASVPVDLLDLYVDAGVDVVEFGWPAREPYLDGTDVRNSMARAARGDPRSAFDAARQQLSRRQRAPRRLIMTYAEERHPALVDPAFFSGVDAMLVVAPAGDTLREDIEAKARGAGAALAAFVTLPISSPAIARAKRAGEYVMLQAAAGLTGPRNAFDPDNGVRIDQLRAQGITAPIALGFGISNGEQARAAVDSGANGVVVGSAVLRAALSGRAELAALLKQLREGLDG